jgi:hypothetical protein
LVTYLLWSGPPSLETPPLDVPIDVIELFHEGVEFFLLLAEGISRARMRAWRWH